MTFRARLLLGFGAVVAAPLILLGVGLRNAVSTRLALQDERRVQTLVQVIQSDLARESRGLAARLAALREAATADNRLRTGVEEEESPYVLDYAGSAMRLSGLDMLQLQDAAGRIVSSGHFRNEFGRLDPQLPRLIGRAGDMVLVRPRTAAGGFLALARVDSFHLGARTMTIIGGVRIDSAFLARLTPDSALAVSLDTSGATLSQATDRGVLLLPAVTAGGSVTPARIVVTASGTALRAIQSRFNGWLAAALGVAGAIALMSATWLSQRLTHPIADLADRTRRLDLERLDVEFSSERTDEIGVLTRMLGAMTQRLREGASRLRDAERRLAMGELARQVNHDIKNGLVPIRNVFRHFAETARQDPDRLARVFGERQGTIDSGIAYLEGLAGNYSRLYAAPAAERCEVNQVIRETLPLLVPPAGGLQVDLAEVLPEARVDALVLRRVIQNLVGNARDAAASSGGAVTVTTGRGGDNGEPSVRVVVADTGMGMIPEQLSRALAGFYTTKIDGTGLGLAIVRRLVLDAGGRLQVDTQPGKGTVVTVELPI